MELTVLMPCLNEAATVANCVVKARDFLERAAVKGEVLVADNGSVDGSPSIAAAAGARVIHVGEPGYGAALRAGIEAAQGRYVIMGDADDSYDFYRLEPFLIKLREGFPLVMGNRFKGAILPGAMPALHRYLGNPILSFVGRMFFRVQVGDFHCGLRGFDRERILALGLQTSGMEFASEVIVKAALAGWRIAEVPITLAPDGRGRPSHLRSWRDGWRHLRFLLLLSPRWLFLYPGLLLLTLGGALIPVLYFTPVRIGGAVLDIHTMLYASAAVMLGLQFAVFALVARLSSQYANLLPRSEALTRLLAFWSLERGLLVGFGLLVAGLAWSVIAVWQWGQANFGTLNPATIMRTAIPATTLMIGGMEIVLASFLVSVLRLRDEPVHADPS